MHAEEQHGAAARAPRPAPITGEERAWEEAEQEWRDSQRFVTRRLRASRPVAETRRLARRPWVVRYWALALGALLLAGLAALYFLR